MRHHGYRSSFLPWSGVHIVDVDKVAVQVAAVLHLHGEGAVAENAHVTLELRRSRNFISGCFGVVGHLARPGAIAIEARIIAALRGAVADVTASFVAAVDAFVFLWVGRLATLA